MDFCIIVNDNTNHYRCVSDCVKGGPYTIYEDVSHEYGDMKYVVCDKSIGVSKQNITASFKNEKDAAAFCAYKNACLIE